MRRKGFGFKNVIFVILSLALAIFITYMLMTYVLPVAALGKWKGTVMYGLVLLFSGVFTFIFTWLFNKRR
ncbi:hypothetical protein [Ohessyouella blattaphilus]|uniref:Uncharacterized protein n=1 Tax=Ohessyouella blattaphilus TaxID=2949333 RepID=A0ABT1EHT4_9FIRM|nr:hypothetical protein [Ohessyouella blattaphilus]MCP1110265.1 hypothetical protein [Ohessyouella blattaphilus]MCR8563659.1 hypothetical protein [Ohessyouella blattaphilus]